MTNTPPQLPQDTDAERLVLGSCLLDPAIVQTISLTPGEFYDGRHADTWRAMQSLSREGVTPDYANLSNHLERHGQLDAVGGSLYLSGLALDTFVTANVQDYADRVRQMAGRRSLIRLAQDIAATCYDPKKDADAKRSDWLAQMVSTYHLREKAEPIAQHVMALSREIEERAKNPREIFGIPTGMADWDRITKGLQRGEEVLLAGQPKMGKSMFAAQMGIQVAMNGYGVAYYALEMSGVATVRRQLSGMTGIPSARLRGGFIHDGEWEHINQSLAELSPLPFYLSDSTRWTTVSLRADVARLKAQADIAVVVVDHDGLLKDQAEDKNEKDKMVSQALHDIAKDFDVAMIAIHTMNKAGMTDGAPVLAAASGSVRFIYDADVVCFLTEHLPQNGEQPQPNVRTLTFAAYREDSPDRYMHLVLKQVLDGGKMRGLPRLEAYAEGY